MTDIGNRGAATSRVLEVAEAVSPMEAVEAVTRELAAALGATAVSFLIADLSGRALARLAHVTLARSTGDSEAAVGDRRDVEESAMLLPFDGGPVEQALRNQQLRLLPPGQSYAGGVRKGQWTVLAPVTERGEVLGLLEMSLPGEPDSDTLSEIARTAHLLGFVVIANRRHTDLFEWGQRSTPFTLPAEIQRRLLPAAYTCEGGARRHQQRNRHSSPVSQQRERGCCLLRGVCQPHLAVVAMAGCSSGPLQRYVEWRETVSADSRRRRRPGGGDADHKKAAAALGMGGLVLGIDWSCPREQEATMTISTGPGAADVPDRDEGARAADVSDSPSTSTPPSAGGDGGTVQQAAGTASEEAGRVAGVAKGQAQQVASEIGTQARDLVGELRTQVHDQSVTQRDRLVENLRRFGDDLDGMRRSSTSSGLAADLTGMLASKAREVSTFLSDHEPGDLIEEVRQFARQRPGTFLLGAAVAGVIAGRLTRGAAASSDLTSSAGSSGRHRLDPDNSTLSTSEISSPQDPAARLRSDEPLLVSEQGLP